MRRKFENSILHRTAIVLAGNSQQRIYKKIKGKYSATRIAQMVSGFERRVRFSCKLDMLVFHFLSTRAARQWRAVCIDCIDDWRSSGLRPTSNNFSSVDSSENLAPARPVTLVLGT